MVKNGNTYSLNSCLGYECDYIELSELDKLMLENTWKPSDEQMAILYKYAEQNNYDGSILTSLYNELKKLREE